MNVLFEFCRRFFRCRQRRIFALVAAAIIDDSGMQLWKAAALVVRVIPSLEIRFVNSECASTANFSAVPSQQVLDISAIDGD
jgi:hypothetical protein